MRGFEGWGRHLCGGSGTGAREHVALTHPSNLREIRARIVTASSIGSDGHESRSSGTRRPNALGLEHAAITQQRIENAREATGESDDGHLFAAARGDAQSPGPQRLGFQWVSAEDRDRGLNQEPAGARVTGLGDRPAALRLPGAVLAGHEAELGVAVLPGAGALRTADSPA